MNNEIFLRDKLSFYNHLTKIELELLHNGIFEKKFSKGESIHGDEGNCYGLLIVKRGTLRVHMLSDEGRDITIYYIEQGETCIMSASCVLREIVFEVFIEADSDVEVIQINASVFSKLKQNIHVENFALKEAVRRFSDVMWTMQQLIFLSFDKRLAMYLYDTSNKHQSNVINNTHEQIAKAVGSAREVVTRMLQQFARDNIVTLSRAKVEILDKKALIKIFST
jgi:CRP/FNR family transcriptional regulator